MPILKREADLFPAGLFELDEGEHPWRVAHTRSRQEKVLARYLLERRVPFYLPQSELKTKRNGRNFVSWSPLFTSYVFIRAAKQDCLTVHRSGVVANLIDVPDQSELQHQLAQIHTLQESGAVLISHPYLAAGDAVRITDGVFKGYEGVIVKEKGETRLVISIDLIRQSVVAELSREAVAPSLREVVIAGRREGEELARGQRREGRERR